MSQIAKLLVEQHGFKPASIELLHDKGFKTDEDFGPLYAAMAFDQTFESRRRAVSPLERMLTQGDAIDITSGRYHRYISGFHDISSEQALVQGRLKFAIEYVIALGDFLPEKAPDNTLIQVAFTDRQKEKLRSIYEGFNARDYLAVKLIERKTKHDIVAANIWATIRSQQLGFDERLMRRIMHFARTSADVNTNVMGELYFKAIGQWTKSVAGLVKTLQEKAREYKRVTFVGETHGQPAQLTTLGHIYANIAQQIKAHAKPLTRKQALRLEGKIAGAIGTDVDMGAASIDVNPTSMYKQLVQGHFGLEFVELGHDQDCTNAGLAQALDTIVNVGNVIKKAAQDHWLYASKGLLSKITDKQESGSSAMPQKANPFLAEGCEALMEISAAMVGPIKSLIAAYRTQGDLRRSITKREGYHPIMLSIIGIERLRQELEKYEPNFVAIERSICQQGVGITSSAVQTYLREKGVDDAYDGLKSVVMGARVDPEKVEEYITGLVGRGSFEADDARVVGLMIESTLCSRDLLAQYERNPSEEVARTIATINRDVDVRALVLGNVLDQTERMAGGANFTIRRLERYAA